MKGRFICRIHLVPASWHTIHPSDIQVMNREWKCLDRHSGFYGYGKTPMAAFRDCVSYINHHKRSKK